MAASTGPNLGMLQRWAARESGWNTGMDANLLALDALVMASVKNLTTSAPPGSPANGDGYIVKATGTGAWAGHDTHIAVYDSVGAAWKFYTPKAGWVVFDQATALLYYWSGSAWVKYERGVVAGTAKSLWLPSSRFGYNLNVVASGATPGVGRSSPLDDKAFEYINLPAAGDTYLHTWFQVPDDFGTLTAWDLYLVSTGTSATNLTLWWSYIMAAADGNFADNGSGYTTLTLTVSPASANRMVIKTGLTLPTGPPTLTAGGIAKMELERVNANDANPDDYRFIGLRMRYTTP